MPGCDRLPDAPRAPGGCPDFDVDAFITFAHREPAWQGLQQEVAAIRKAIEVADWATAAHLRVIDQAAAAKAATKGGRR